jgi:1,4-alpha-glucan branching enzyme
MLRCSINTTPMKPLHALALSLCLTSSLRALGAPASMRKPGEPVTFTLRAAKAQDVKLRGQWSKEPLPLVRADDGTWSTTLDAVPSGVWEYSFDVDGVNVMDSKNDILVN